MVDSAPTKPGAAGKRSAGLQQLESEPVAKQLKIASDAFVTTKGGKTVASGASSSGRGAGVAPAENKEQTGTNSKVVAMKVAAAESCAAAATSSTKNASTAAPAASASSSSGTTKNVVPAVRKENVKSRLHEVPQRHQLAEKANVEKRAGAANTSSSLAGNKSLNLSFQPNARTAAPAPGGASAGAAAGAASTNASKGGPSPRNQQRGGAAAAASSSLAPHPIAVAAGSNANSKKPAGGAATSLAKTAKAHSISKAAAPTANGKTKGTGKGEKNQSPRNAAAKAAGSGGMSTLQLPLPDEKGSLKRGGGTSPELVGSPKAGKKQAPPKSPGPGGKRKTSFDGDEKNAAAGKSAASEPVGRKRSVSFDQNPSSAGAKQVQVSTPNSGKSPRAGPAKHLPSAAKIDAEPPATQHELPKRDMHEDLKPAVGLHTLKGKRPDNEDAHIDMLKFSETGFDNLGLHASKDSPLQLYGVFDGHGGKACASWIARHLPDKLREMLTKMNANVTQRDLKEIADQKKKEAQYKEKEKALALREKELAGGLATAGAGLGAAALLAAPGSGAASSSGAPSPRASTADARKVQNEMKKLEKDKTQLGSEKQEIETNKTGYTVKEFDRVKLAILFTFELLDVEYVSTNLRSDAGCTAVVCLLDTLSQNIFCANVGDSRAMIGRSMSYLPLSRDHELQNQIERARVEGAGGTVDEDGYVNETVNMTRCLGDRMGKFREVDGFYSRNYALASAPEIKMISITETHQFLLLCCDGLFESKDIFTNASICSRARELLKQGDSEKKVAKKLCSEAIERGSGDNVSVMLVLLNSALGNGPIASASANAKA